MVWGSSFWGQDGVAVLKTGTNKAGSHFYLPAKEVSIQAGDAKKDQERELRGGKLTRKSPQGSKLKQFKRLSIIYFLGDLKKNPITFRTLNRNTEPGLKERIRGSP